MRNVVKLLKRLRLRAPFSKKKNTSGDKSQTDAMDFRDIGQREADIKKAPLVASLEENLRRIKETIGNSYDLSVRHSLAGPEKVPCALSISTVWWIALPKKICCASSISILLRPDKGVAQGEI